MAWTVDWRKVRLGQRLQALLPVLLLGSLALLTYWLVQNSPILAEDTSGQSASVKPNAYFHRFRLVSFGAKGEWEMQLSGQRASHRADIERYDIDAPQLLRRDSQTGAATQVSAQRAGSTRADRWCSSTGKPSSSAQRIRARMVCSARPLKFEVSICCSTMSGMH